MCCVCVSNQRAIKYSIIFCGKDILLLLLFAIEPWMPIHLDIKYVFYFVKYTVHTIHENRNKCKTRALKSYIAKIAYVCCCHWICVFIFVHIISLIFRVLSAFSLYLSLSLFFPIEWMTAHHLNNITLIIIIVVLFASFLWLMFSFIFIEFH